MSSFSQTFRISPAPSSAKVMTLPPDQRLEPQGPLPGHVLVGQIWRQTQHRRQQKHAPVGVPPPDQLHHAVEIPAHQRQDQGLVPSLHVRVLPALKFAWLQPLSCLSGGSAMHSRSRQPYPLFPGQRARRNAAEISFPAFLSSRLYASLPPLTTKAPRAGMPAARTLPAP